MSVYKKIIKLGAVVLLIVPDISFGMFRGNRFVSRAVAGAGQSGLASSSSVVSQGLVNPSISRGLQLQQQELLAKSSGNQVQAAVPTGEMPKQIPMRYTVQEIRDADRKNADMYAQNEQNNTVDAEQLPKDVQIAESAATDIEAEGFLQGLEAANAMESALQSVQKEDNFLDQLDTAASYNDFDRDRILAKPWVRAGGMVNTDFSTMGTMRRFRKSDLGAESHKGFITNIGKLKNVGIRYFGNLPIVLPGKKLNLIMRSSGYFNISYPIEFDITRLSVMKNKSIAGGNVIVPSFTSLYVMDLPFFDFYIDIVESLNKAFDFYGKILFAKMKQFDDQYENCFTSLLSFHEQYLPDLENILLRMGNLEEQKELIALYKVVFKEYCKNPSQLGHYFYVAMILNEMLNLAYYNNMKEVIIKKTIEKNSHKRYNFEELTFFPDIKNRQGYYSSHARLMNLSPLEQFPARDLFAVYHELQHSAQGFDSMDSDESYDAERDADRTAINQIQCSTCLQIVQATRRDMAPFRGYFTALEFEGAISNTEYRHLSCKAHAANLELTKEIQEQATKIMRSKEFLDGQIKKLQKLDCQSGTLWDHFLPADSKQSEKEK